MIFTLAPIILTAQNERYIYQEIDGIVANEIIKGIVKDATGYVWLATDQGVLHYDGTGAFLYYKELQSPFTKNFLNTADNRLLVINDFGLKEIINEGDTVYFAPFVSGDRTYDQPLNYPKSIYQDQAGNIWIGEVNSIVRINASGFRRFDLGAEFQSISYHRTFSFDEDAFGNLWVAPFKGNLLRYDPASDRLERVEVDLPVTDVTGLTVVRGDYLLVGGKEGMFQIKIDSDHRILDTRFLKNVNNISAILAVDRTVYVGTWDRGFFLYDFNDGGIRRSESVGFNDIVDFYHDQRSGEVWVAGSENVGLFTRSVISSIADVGQYRVESMAVSGHELFYSIGQEIRHLDLRRPDPVSRVIESQDKYFDCLEVADGDLWIGDSFGAIYRYDMSEDRLVRIKDSVGRAVKFAFEDRDGNKWFTGDENGLIKIDRQDRIVYYANVTTSNIIRQSPEGTIFCGAYGNDQLLFRYAPAADTFRKVAVTPDLVPKYNISIEDIAFGTEGELWLASNHGLFRWEKDAEELQQVHISDMDVDEYYKALAYHQGVLWAACTRGLAAFDGEDAILFTNDNGLPSKILKERGLRIYQDKLLVATAKGLARVDMANLQFEKTPRPIFKKVIVNGKNVQTGTLEEVTLPYKGRLQAEFVTLTYPGKDIVYQSRLSDVEV